MVWSKNSDKLNKKGPVLWGIFMVSFANEICVLRQVHWCVRSLRVFLWPSPL